MPTQSGHSRGQKLERCNVLPRLVGHEPQTGGPTSYGDGLVLPTWAKVSLFKDTDVTQLMETALVRRTYAGWCGGTVAKATSYPISKGVAGAHASHGDAMFVCGWNFVCRTISYLRRQTLRLFVRGTNIIAQSRIPLKHPTTFPLHRPPFSPYLPAIPYDLYPMAYHYRKSRAVLSFILPPLARAREEKIHVPENIVWPSDIPWWRANNLRVIQTNLPAYEAALNVDSLVADLQHFSANTLIINAGGIMAFYPTKLQYHYTNPHMQPNMLQ